MVTHQRIQINTNARSLYYNNTMTQRKMCENVVALRRVHFYTIYLGKFIYLYFYVIHLLTQKTTKSSIKMYLNTKCKQRYINTKILYANFVNLIHT